MSTHMSIRATGPNSAMPLAGLATVTILVITAHNILVITIQTPSMPLAGLATVTILVTTAQNILVITIQTPSMPLAGLAWTMSIPARCSVGRHRWSLASAGSSASGSAAALTRSPAPTDHITIYRPDHSAVMAAAALTRSPQHLPTTSLFTGPTTALL